LDVFTDLIAAQTLDPCLLVICSVIAGCKHSASPGDEHPQVSTNSTAKPSNSDNIDIFDPKLHPCATVIHPLDPQTLTDSQIKFGVAPRRDPSVEYQPDIILIENGDKAPSPSPAIESLSSLSSV